MENTATQSEHAVKSPEGLSRPPIVVVLGHVDHGKTTLLDSIRKTDVAAGEQGGITQKIGAYQVELPSKEKITFIDTPGHEAFTKMRSRGAMAADIAVLVVAANDSVMPQTVESIKIIQAAGLPYIVAINKVDLPEANIDKVIQDLLRHNVLLENYGGQVPFVKISAKNSTGIPDLLGLISLLAQMNNITGDQDDELSAVIIESKLDKNRGPLASVVVKNGSLKSGEKIVVQGKENKIRALVNERGVQLPIVLPGMPAEILGLSFVPEVGERILHIGQTAAVLPAVVAARSLKTTHHEAENILNIILKADTLGSLEAINASLPENVRPLLTATGEINEQDILLAKSTGAIVLGFNTKAGSDALKLAETEKVLVRTYKIIYELLEEIRDAAAGVLTLGEPEIMGVGTIIAQFPYEKMRVAGTKITDGRLARGDTVKIMRGEAEIAKSKIKSVRLGREESSKVEAPKECGILLDPQIDFSLGDAIIAYRV